MARIAFRRFNALRGEPILTLRRTPDTLDEPPHDPGGQH
jgi:hypothetical protein